MNCYFAVPQLTFATVEGEEASLTQQEGHREPQSKVGSQSPTEHLLRFEPGSCPLATTPVVLANDLATLVLKPSIKDIHNLLMLMVHFHEKYAKPGYDHNIKYKEKDSKPLKRL